MKQITYSNHLDGLGWLFFYLGLIALIPSIPWLAISSLTKPELPELFFTTVPVFIFIIISFSGYKFVQRIRWSWYVLLGVFALADALSLYMLFVAISTALGAKYDFEQDDEFNLLLSLVIKYSISIAYFLCVLGTSLAIVFLLKRQCREEFQLVKL